MVSYLHEEIVKAAESEIMDLRNRIKKVEDEGKRPEEWMEIRIAELRVFVVHIQTQEGNGMLRRKPR